MLCHTGNNKNWLSFQTDNLIHLHLYSQISDCGMVLEEQPGKVSEAFRLFLQGEGYGK